MWVSRYFSYLGGGGKRQRAGDRGAGCSDRYARRRSYDRRDKFRTANPPNFPVTPFPIQSTLNGTQNAFFAQIDTTTSSGQNGSWFLRHIFRRQRGGPRDQHRGRSEPEYLLCRRYYLDSNLATRNPLQSTLTPGATSNAFVVKLGTATDLCITCVPPVISPAGTVSAGNQVIITFTVANEGPDPATNITVTGTVTTGATFVSGTAGAGTCSDADQ